MTQSHIFMSIYIPFILHDRNEEFIKEYFKNQNIADIERVDFCYEGNWKNGRSAFVHIKNWYYSENSCYLYEKLYDPNGLKILINKNEYWILKEMICPKIYSTELNIHQVVSKIESLEKKIRELESVIQYQQREPEQEPEPEQEQEQEQ